LLKREDLANFVAVPEE
jgi:ubiquitin-conjugating enzyme E2 J2